MIKKLKLLEKNPHLFLLFFVISEFFYLSLYIIAPLKTALGDFSLGIKNVLIIALVILILFFLFILHSVILEVADFSKLKVKYIFWAVTLFNLSLFFVKPITSDDFYTYIQRGRIVSQYRENPYVTPYSEFSNDSLKNDITTAWSGNTEIYGPFMVYINAMLTFLGGNSLFWNLFFFKTFFIIANLACSFLILRITGDKKSLFVYSANPLIVFVFSVDLHNDVIMILLFLLGFFLITGGELYRKLLGFSFFILSALSKEFTLIFVPFIFLFLVRKETGVKRRIFLGLVLVAISVIILYILYLPFWKGFVIFERLKELTGYGVIAASPGVTLVTLATGFFSQNSELIANILNKSVFIVFYFIYLMKALFKKGTVNLNGVNYYFLAVTTIFFLTFFTRFFPWYSSLLIVVLALYWGMRKKYDKKYILYTFMIYSLITYIMIL